MTSGATSVRPWRAVLATALLCLAGTAGAGADDARAWIQRMNTALSTRNYDGVFALQVGGRREVLRIIHRIGDGRMTERLVSTDGSGREFVRNGSEWVAYFPDRRVAMVETRNRSYGFITTLRGLSEESDRYYAISTSGTQRLQGHVTQMITVEPRDALRYGYRFWIDQQTAMPIKTQLVSRSGEVIEEIAFISLSLPDRIPDELLKTDVDARGFRWMRRDEPEGSPLKMAFAPQAERLPAGFRMRVFDGADAASRAAARTRFIVSDGIAWVSVFVEPSDSRPRVTRHAGARADGVVVMGPSSAYVDHREGYRVTVVGEVPPQTVRAIAEAVQPE